MPDLSKPLFFDIDGICQLKVHGEPGLVQVVWNELKFYEVEPGAIPFTLDLELQLARLGDYVKSTNPANMPPFDFAGRHKLARWVVRFERLEQAPHRMRFYGNWASRLVLAKQIIEPAIRWLSFPLGFIFVHSTCLCREGRGVLVAGPGGSGKTRLLLRWLAQGYPFLSDDYTILSWGQARRFITPLRLGARLLRESGARQNLGTMRQAWIYGRAALRRLLLNYAKLQAKVDFRELFPQVPMLETAELKAAIVIEGSSQSLSEIQAGEMTEKLSGINQEEMYGFAGYLEGLSARTGNSSFREFFPAQKERLLHFLSSIPCFRIGEIRNFKLSEVDGLIGEISDLLKP